MVACSKREKSKGVTYIFKLHNFLLILVLQECLGVVNIPFIGVGLINLDSMYFLLYFNIFFLLQFLCSSFMLHVHGLIIYALLSFIALENILEVVDLRLNNDEISY